MNDTNDSALVPHPGHDAAAAPTFADLLGENVVVDLSSPYVYLGRLVEQQDAFLVLKDVDCHDLRDTQSTRERYILEARLHGIEANREWAWVAVREIVGVSRLADVRPH